MKPAPGNQAGTWRTIAKIKEVHEKKRIRRTRGENVDEECAGGRAFVEIIHRNFKHVDPGIARGGDFVSVVDAERNGTGETTLCKHLSFLTIS